MVQANKGLEEWRQVQNFFEGCLMERDFPELESLSNVEEVEGFAKKQIASLSYFSGIMLADSGLDAKEIEKEFIKRMVRLWEQFTKHGQFHYLRDLYDWKNRHNILMGESPSNLKAWWELRALVGKYAGLELL